MWWQLRIENNHFYFTMLIMTNFQFYFKMYTTFVSLTSYITLPFPMTHVFISTNQKMAPHHMTLLCNSMCQFHYFSVSLAVLHYDNSFFIYVCTCILYLPSSSSSPSLSPSLSPSPSSSPSTYPSTSPYLFLHQLSHWRLTLLILSHIKDYLYYLNCQLPIFISFLNS